MTTATLENLDAQSAAVREKADKTTALTPEPRMGYDDEHDNQTTGIHLPHLRLFLDATNTTTEAMS